jgi:hypothetical protein
VCREWTGPSALKLVPYRPVVNILEVPVAFLRPPGILHLGWTSRTEPPMLEELGTDVVGASTAQVYGGRPVGCAWKADGALICWGIPVIQAEGFETIESVGHDVVQAAVSRDGRHHRLRPQA